MGLPCFFLLAGLCFDAHELHAQSVNFGNAYAASVSGKSWTVQTGAIDIINMHDFRKAPRACSGDVCVRYFKFCAPAAPKLHCTYYVVWPGIVPDGKIVIDADDAAALAEAERVTSIPIDRDGKTVKLSFTTMTVLAATDTPPDCPNGDFKTCTPP